MLDNKKEIYDNIDVVNIVICYNNAEEVSVYADEFFALSLSEKSFLVVVINAAQENDKKIIENIKKKYKNILVVDAGRNLGYLNGLLFGYKQYSLVASKTPRFVIMSNTDIEYQDIDFLDILLNKTYPADIWCIGPSVYTKYTANYDNPVAEKRRSRSEINKLVRRFSLPVFSWLYVYLSNVKAKYKRSKKTESRYVYEVHGCYFILVGEFAEIIKEEKYGSLMYSEEAFISELIYHYGKREYYDADIEVIHIEHTATKLLGAVKIANHLSESMKYIRERFY